MGTEQRKSNTCGTEIDLKNFLKRLV